MKKQLLCAGMTAAICAGMAWEGLAFDVMSIGAHGEQVIQLQTALTELGYFDEAVDGSFGLATKTAVKRFQRENELDANGDVGAATYKKLMVTAGILTEEELQGEAAETEIDEDGSFENAVTGKTFSDDDFTYEELENGTVRIVEYHGAGGEVKISSQVEGKIISGIGNGVFMDNTTITAIENWADLKYLGNGAFKGCTGLEEISIPSSVENLGISCFEGCTSLKEVTFWAKLEVIPDYCFKNCVALKEISISSDNKYIGVGAFENCAALKDVTFWGGENIGTAAFRNCTKLDDVSISREIEYIGPEAFAGCSGLKDVTFWGKESTEVVENAFEGCPYELGGGTVIPVPAGYLSPEDDSEELLAKTAAEAAAASMDVIAELSEAKSLEDICAFIKKNGEVLGGDIETKSADLLLTIDSYASYRDNEQNVQEFFAAREADAQAFYDLIKESAVAYYQMLIDTTEIDDYNAWDDGLSEFYDAWDEAMTDYYDAWDGAYSDLYEGFDTVISEGYNIADYSEASDTWSSMYSMYSDSWSSMYSSYSNNWSYVYTLHSEIFSGVSNGNIDLAAAMETAEEELKEKDPESEEQDSSSVAEDSANSEEKQTSEDASAEENEAADADGSSTAGVSQEFKEAMDSYEAFFDEYVAAVKKMEESPDDMSVLVEVNSYMEKYNDTMEKFEELEDSDMSEEERAYYLEVQLRITEKLLAE
ncbi:MAG: leucine-rich repeat protein [Lachnospiraceae bacterium]|nr:leucine-rich repeat protein [Lachnospiraceae bacterium]